MSENSEILNKLTKNYNNINEIEEVYKTLESENKIIVVYADIEKTNLKHKYLSSPNQIPTLSVVNSWEKEAETGKICVKVVKPGIDRKQKIKINTEDDLYDNLYPDTEFIKKIYQHQATSGSIRINVVEKFERLTKTKITWHDKLEKPIQSEIKIMPRVDFDKLGRISGKRKHHTDSDGSDQDTRAKTRKKGTVDYGKCSCKVKKDNCNRIDSGCEQATENIFCNFTNCSVPEICKNTLENINKIETEIRETDNMGEGLFTKQDIKAGEMVIEYVGLIKDTEPENTTYTAELKTHFIDASDPEKSKNSRFINSSCEPNLHPIVWRERDSSYDRMVFVACTDIKKGSQLFWRYGVQYWKNSGKFCACKSQKCDNPEPVDQCSKEEKLTEIKSSGGETQPEPFQQNETKIFAELKPVSPKTINTIEKPVTQINPQSTTSQISIETVIEKKDENKQTGVDGINDSGPEIFEKIDLKNISVQISKKLSNDKKGKANRKIIENRKTRNENKNITAPLGKHPPRIANAFRATLATSCKNPESLDFHNSRIIQKDYYDSYNMDDDSYLIEDSDFINNPKIKRIFRQKEIGDKVFHWRLRNNLYDSSKKDSAPTGRYYDKKKNIIYETGKIIDMEKMINDTHESMKEVEEAQTVSLLYKPEERNNTEMILRRYQEEVATSSSSDSSDTSNHSGESYGDIATKFRRSWSDDCLSEKSEEECAIENTDKTASGKDLKEDLEAQQRSERIFKIVTSSDEFKILHEISEHVSKNAILLHPWACDKEKDCAKAIGLKNEQIVSDNWLNKLKDNVKQIGTDYSLLEIIFQKLKYMMERLFLEAVTFVESEKEDKYEQAVNRHSYVSRLGLNCAGDIDENVDADKVFLYAQNRLKVDLDEDLKAKVYGYILNSVQSYKTDHVKKCSLRTLYKIQNDTHIALNRNPWEREINAENEENLKFSLIDSAYTLPFDANIVKFKT